MGCRSYCKRESKFILKLKNQSKKKKKSYFQFRNVANGVLNFFYKLEKFLKLKHLLPHSLKCHDKAKANPPKSFGNKTIWIKSSQYGGGIECSTIVIPSCVDIRYECKIVVARGVDCRPELECVVAEFCGSRNRKMSSRVFLFVCDAKLWILNERKQLKVKE